MKTIDRGVEITNRGGLLYWLLTKGSSGHECCKNHQDISEIHFIDSLDRDGGGHCCIEHRAGHCSGSGITEPPPLLLDLGELTKIGGLFLTVLITVELFGILEVMLLESTVHVEFVVAVALIAAAREVLVVEVTSVAPMTLVGLAALILALGAGYYLIKRAGPPGTDSSKSP